MSRQRAITGTINTDPAGSWRVVSRKPGGTYVDATIFRGAPTGVGDFSFSDPFGPTSMTLSFPQVTIFDMPGYGDLNWLVRHGNVDVVWDGYLPPKYPFGFFNNGVWTPRWRWEGYIVSFAFDSKSGLTVQAKGALLQLDNYLAKPEYTARPIPYEWAIARQFKDKPSLRLGPFSMVWPTWWTKKYTPPAKGTPSYQIPAGVTKGDYWTGMTTRETGSWDPTLTSYIQTMLSSMYTNRGRWTIDLQAGRAPWMIHRDFIAVPDEATVVVDPVAPETTINLTEDWEASMTTVYGQGTSIDGVTYSGMNISSDGELTGYTPLAASRQVWPTLANPWHDPKVMAKEVMVQMQAGLDGEDAAVVGRAHLARFADPGVTGTVTLGSDPSMGGAPVPRHLVRAGMNIHIPYIFGRPEGVLANISASSHSIASGTTTLTIDSKRRDALTVEEVRLRGRDAMAVSRMLIGGSYAPVIPDQMVPWSYAEGSGFMPKAATALFKSMPRETSFPYVSWTTAHPPSNPKWAPSYVCLPHRSADANKNWITTTDHKYGIPIRMAQAGSVRLVQIAAYNADGSVAKVPFHVSFYNVNSVNVLSMPAIPADQAKSLGFGAAQHYPFIRDGWEEWRADGSAVDPLVPQPITGAGLIKGWGNFYERAGHWPGSYAEGDPATGLLVDESPWSFDMVGVGDAFFDKYKAERNLSNTKAGMLYAMIYCDAQVGAPVYFMGRIFRAEPAGKES